MSYEPLTPETLLRERAASLGFIGVGFTNPNCPPYFRSFQSWLSQGRYGDMEWIARNVELRRDPKLLLPGCNTVISLAYPYSPEIPTSPDGLRAARYTEGLQEDYHLRLRTLGKALVELIRQLYPGAKSRICIDSAPVLERSIAYRAGVGFFGKNTMLIIPGYGSYFYLMELFTSAAISFEKPKPMESKCGQCTKCIGACPTGALKAPFIHDARHCLSYLTIEHKGQLSREVGQIMNRCFFGCDVCQEVCPFNQKDTGARITLPSAKEILEMHEDEFQYIFGNTAFARAGLKKIQANVQTALLQEH